MCIGEKRAGHFGPFFHKVAFPQFGMRILSKILWVLAFLAATFIWMVLFEHGFSMKGLTEGTQKELQAIGGWFSGSKK